MLLLLFLLQGVAEPRAPEDAVRAFVKGDPAAREEILTAGAGLMMALRKVRDQAPDRVDALLYDLKKAAAGFEVESLVAALEARRTLEAGEMNFIAGIDELTNGLPLILDPALYRTHYQRKVSLNLKDRARREILGSLCRQTDLDYGFFYGVILVGSPERLWPAGPPPRVLPLSAEESRRASLLLDRLGSDQVEERTQATALLRKFGEGLIPLLEKRARESDGERRARCQDLIGELRKPPPSGIFHLPGAARQKLIGDNAVLRKMLEEGGVGFKVADISLDGALRLLLTPRKVPVELARSLRNNRVTLDIQDKSTWTVVCLATHSSGFDFLILDGKVVVDTREEIERRLATGH